jgi:hypothetical protein
MKTENETEWRRGKSAQLTEWQNEAENHSLRPSDKKKVQQIRVSRGQKKNSNDKGCLPPCKKKMCPTSQDKKKVRQKRVSPALQKKVCLTSQERKKSVPHRVTKKKKMTAKTASFALKRKKQQDKGCSSPCHEKKKIKVEKGVTKKK